MFIAIPRVHNIYRYIYYELLVIHILASSEHVKSSKLGGSLKATFQALKSMQLQGNVKQQGGQFVLGPGKTVHIT